MDILKSFVLDGVSHDVSILWEEGKPLMRADDIGKVLGLSNVRTSVQSFDADERCVRSTYTSCGARDVVFLTEPGVYRLLMLSRKPIARPFQKWVTQVIVSIRETGEYRLRTQMEQAAEAVRMAEEQVAKAVRTAEEQVGLAVRMAEEAAEGVRMAEEKAKCFSRLASEEKVRCQNIIDRANHDALVKAFKDIYVVYFGIIRYTPDGRMLIKVGSSKHVQIRVESEVAQYGGMTLFQVIPCDMHEQFERFLQGHTRIRQFVYRDVIHGTRRSNGEVFLMDANAVEMLKRIAVANVHKYKRQVAMDHEMDLERERQHRLVYDAEKKEHLALARQTLRCVEGLMTEANVVANAMATAGKDAKAPASAIKLTHEPSLDDASDTFDDVSTSSSSYLAARRYTQARGPKIQRYTLDGVLVRTYPGVSDALRDPDANEPSQSALKAAIVKRTEYKGFRWANLERALPDDTVQDIGETAAGAAPRQGMVAMLQLDRTRVVQVFCDAKAASEDRHFSNGAAISAAIQRGSQSGGHYFVMWTDVAPKLQHEYLARATLPAKRVRSNGRAVEQLHPATRAVIQRFSSVEDVRKAVRISRANLDTAITHGLVANGFRWRRTALAQQGCDGPATPPLVEPSSAYEASSNVEDLRTPLAPVPIPEPSPSAEPTDAIPGHSCDEATVDVPTPVLAAEPYERRRGLVARLDKTKTIVLGVYESQTAAVASPDVALRNSNSITIAIRRDSLADKCRWMWYEDCTAAQRATFTGQLPAVPRGVTCSRTVQQIDPHNQEVVKVHACMADACIAAHTCHKTLLKYSESGAPYKGFVWKVTA
jgi:prophage antirepressor-like protein